MGELVKYVNLIRVINSTESEFFQNDLFHK